MDSEKKKALGKAVFEVAKIATDAVKGIRGVKRTAPYEEGTENLLKAGFKTAEKWDDVKMVADTAKGIVRKNMIPVAKKIAPAAKNAVESITKQWLKK